jgi:hypothetical protein
MNPATLSGPNNERSMTPAMRASRLLGWASFAIGAAELLAPKRVARAVGVPEERTAFVRACGVRQMATGVGAHSVYPVPALWARFAGDLVDLGALAVAARRPEGGRNRGAWIAMGAVLGIAALDAVIASRLATETKEGKGGERDYSDRSGFPQGVEAARGAGIVRDAPAGKAGGAAAGDVSPAGESDSGRTSTDLAGAPAANQRTAGAAAPQEEGAGMSGQGSSTGAGFIGGGMPEESKKVIPEPPSYTPA